MTTDDRTEADALLPAEREMSAAQWAEYGGLPPGLRGYCHLLMRREAASRLREQQTDLEVAEWRERTARLLTRAEAAAQRAEAAEAALAAARDAVDRERGRVRALDEHLATRDAELSEARAELARERLALAAAQAERAEAVAAARDEGEAAGRAAERVAVAWHFGRIAAGLRAEADASQSESYRLWAYPKAQEAENVERIVMSGEHVAGQGA